MARTAIKQKKGSKSASGGNAAALLFLGACAVAAFIALSSPIMSVFYIGFSLLAVLLYGESRDRVQGQAGVGFKIKTLEENARFFTRENVRTRNDILEIQGRLSDVEITGVKNSPEKTRSTAAQIVTKKKGTVQDNFSNKFLTMLKRSAMPRAVKPGSITNSKMPANDGSIDDDLGLSDLVVEELVQHAVSQENINTFLQPIMRLPQRKIEYYEMFARIRARPGVYMPASRYMDIAHQNNLVSSIDTILLDECVKMIKATSHMDKTAPFFMNITGGSLMNKNFMNTLLLFFARHRKLADRLILEMPQNEFNMLAAPIKKIMKALGQLGCTFSIDHVKNLDLDEDYLKSLNVKFIKIAAKTFTAKAQKDTEFAALRHAKIRLEKAGIKIVAEKIESDKTMLELNDYEISLGQGIALAKPDLQSVYEPSYREQRA